MKKIIINSTAKKVAFAGVLASVALILGYVEFLIPFDLTVPGIKLGLANLAVLCALMSTDTKYAAIVASLKILLTSLLFGNVFSFCYSLAGGILSFTVMLLLKKCGKFGIVGISAAGGVAHNLGQITAAVFIVSDIKIAFYIPVLIITGIVTGIVIGICANIILKRIG